MYSKYSKEYVRICNEHFILLNSMSRDAYVLNMMF